MNHITALSYPDFKETSQGKVPYVKIVIETVICLFDDHQVAALLCNNLAISNNIKSLLINKKQSSVRAHAHNHIQHLGHTNPGYGGNVFLEGDSAFFASLEYHEMYNNADQYGLKYCEQLGSIFCSVVVCA